MARPPGCLPGVIIVIRSARLLSGVLEPCQVGLTLSRLSRVVRVAGSVPEDLLDACLLC